MAYALKIWMKIYTLDINLQTQGWAGVDLQSHIQRWYSNYKP